MQDHYEQLGVTPDVTPAQLKAAYHAKLREFPAHTHPQEFKAVRSAYEALRDGDQQGIADFFEPRPITAKLDNEQLEEFEMRVQSVISVDVAKMIRLTF